ncbi:MAG: diguanylate cyclase [Candidatus Omnitrophica bacterium]|nr:diguanylate cyclase [Candidatus Omnitrophota bacterium]
MNKRKINSLDSYCLHRKLIISFSLMSVLPLLVSTYLVSTYILPKIGLNIEIAMSLSISVFIAIIGFFLIKGIFDRIASVTVEAKLIAAGDLSRKLDTKHQDEVGDLSGSLNQLTQRIRSNMDELKGYSEKTTEINLEIQKRILVLSGLMQISSLITQGAKLEDILKLASEKSRFLTSSDVSYMFFREGGREEFSMKIADGINSQYLLKIKVDSKDELFGRVIKTNKPLIFDRQNAIPENLAVGFYEQFRLKNTLVLPIYLRGQVTGLMGVGNARESFLYKKDDVELLEIFAKQIAIAVESDILMHRVEKLEIKDALTGLYNEAFIHSRLQEEIKRAILYRRPCAFVLFDIDNFKKLNEDLGLRHAETALKSIASLIKESVTEIDRVGRSGDDEFSVILPEKNKRQAQKIAEDICKKIEVSLAHEGGHGKKITVSGGVSENPLDGVNAIDLITKARELVDLAKAKGRNCVVSFGGK